MARASIDADICVGHGLCALVAPQLFDLDDSGLAVVTAPELAPEQIIGAEEARDNCPVQAISLD